MKVITYALCLERQFERQEHIGSVLDASGFTMGKDAFFFYGKDKEDGIGDCDVTSHGLTVLRPGEIACYESHVRMWESAMAEGADAVLVFEDDVSLFETKTEFMREICRAPKGWHYIAFHEGDKPWDHEQFAPEYDTKSLQGMKVTSYGTACYAMSRAGMEFYLNYARPIATQIDTFIRYSDEPGAKFRVRIPFADRGGTFPTLIQPTEEG